MAKDIKIKNKNGKYITYEGVNEVYFRTPTDENAVYTEGRAPEAYIKGASVSGDVLTLTKNDDTTVQFSTAGKQNVLTAGNGIEISSNTIRSTYTTCSLPVFSAAGTKVVSVSGVTAGSHPVLDVYVAAAADKEAAYEAWSHIYRVDAGAGSLTFYSDAATTTALTVAVKGY